MAHLRLRVLEGDAERRRWASPHRTRRLRSTCLIFNTASIFAMLSHYAEDKENIYGLDIHYLDAAKRSKN